MTGRLASHHARAVVSVAPAAGAAGTAPGAPGSVANWTEGDKDGFGSASRDGVGYDRVAAGVGAGQLTTIDIRATEARFLCVVQTATAPQWWSVADLRVYR
jgi:hypothetical protein